MSARTPAPRRKLQVTESSRRPQDGELGPLSRFFSRSASAAPRSKKRAKSSHAHEDQLQYVPSPDSTSHHPLPQNEAQRLSEAWQSLVHSPAGFTPYPRSRRQVPLPPQPSSSTPSLRRSISTSALKTTSFTSQPSPTSQDTSPSHSAHSPLHLISSIDSSSYQSYPSPTSPFPSVYHTHPTSLAGPSSTSSRADHRTMSNASNGSILSADSSGFVFPGSRSTARPRKKVSHDGLRIKIVESGNQTSHGSSSNAHNSPNLGRRSSDGHADRRLNSTRNSTSTRSHSPQTFRSRKVSTATAKTSSSSGSERSKHEFVYPGGRSRAQPGNTPLALPHFKLSRPDRHAKKAPAPAGHVGNGRIKFLGITLKTRHSDVARPETPPSPLAFTLALSEDGTPFGYDGCEGRSTTSGGGPCGSEFEAYRDHKRTPEVRQKERMARITSRIGNYPLDPYDSILLDNDRQTGELLNRLSATGSPTFHDYGDNPPRSVLDLGCGQGYWVVDAAIVWKDHGTKVTGYDQVDINRVLLPWAAKQGVAENIRFVRGNFLKQRLPFHNNSFDLVRISSLSLCITVDAWVFVFQEVCRVLEAGGRLELIDDTIIFPYGNPVSRASRTLATASSVAPRVDVQIPTTKFNTFSIYGDAALQNPGLGIAQSVELDEMSEDEFFELYQVEEEPENEAPAEASTSDAGGFDPERPAFRQGGQPTSAFRDPSRATRSSTRLRSWNRRAATARDLESLFEHMLVHKFGIHTRPEEFLCDVMRDVFGRAEEVKSLHLSLAPPDVGTEFDDDGPRGRAVDPVLRSHDRYASCSSAFTHIPSPSPARTITEKPTSSLSRSPGMVLFPSTFIPMTQPELEVHASKHLRILLSCKKFLVEHALEATDDEEIDEHSVLEALWEYENFLRSRFDHPPEEIPRSISVAPSIPESVSTDTQDAMWEYQSELRQRFAWTPDTPATTAKLSAKSRVQSRGRSTSRRTHTDSCEMTHVRTFRVYEAIKLEELGSTS